MALSSMTGFARSHGTHDSYVWAWELKSVNAKGFDLRLRLPPGWDAIEGPTRAHAADVLARGTIYGALAVTREGTAPLVRVNERVLEDIASSLKNIAQRIGSEPPRLDAVLTLRGVVEVVENPESEDDRRLVEQAILGGFDQTLAQLAAMRRREGDSLAKVLTQQLDAIATLAQRAHDAPGRRPEAIKARIAEQIATLLDASARFDPDRLHQEAIIIATKADIREELDRLASHITQARQLIADGSVVGRRLDFIAQELNREANTICSKSNDVELTKTGLELKSVVEQFREQVQNLE